MRRLLFIILTLMSLSPSLSFAYDVLVLQSRSDKGFEEVLKGYHSSRSYSERVIVMSDYAEINIKRIIREDRPRIILAIGDAALKALRDIRSIPVVAVLALSVHKMNEKRANITGICIIAPPMRYIDTFRSMKTRSVGLIYNATNSAWYMRHAHLSAKAAGIELEAREVSTPAEAIKQLETLAGKVDAIWMLPDSVAITRETTEAYFRFGQQHSVPVVSFSQNYLNLGAAAVLEIDRFAIGNQAVGMVEKILINSNLENMPILFPETVKFKFNSAILNNLGLSL